MDAEGWAAFAADAGLGLPLVCRRVGELCENVTAVRHDVAAKLARPGFDAAALSRFVDLAGDHAEQCALTTRK